MKDSTKLAVRKFLNDGGTIQKLPEEQIQRLEFNVNLQGSLYFPAEDKNHIREFFAQQTRTSHP